MAGQLQTKKCRFCSKPISADATECPICGISSDNHAYEARRQETIVGDKVGGHKADGNVITAVVQDSSDVAVGKDIQTAKTGAIHGTFNQMRDVYVGEDKRDKQYQLVLHWDGKTRLRMFDLANRLLSDLDLRGADLSGADLTKANLQKANLSGANLRQASLKGANLTNAILEKTQLQFTDLSGATLANTNLQKADLTGARLDGAILDSALNLKHAVITQAQLRNVHITLPRRISLCFHHLLYDFDRAIITIFSLTIRPLILLVHWTVRSLVLRTIIGKLSFRILQLFIFVLLILISLILLAVPLIPFLIPIKELLRSLYFG